MAGDALRPRLPRGELLLPLANQRTDEYGGSVRNRARFLLEALDAVREVWPERLPLTMRLGSDDFQPDGVQFEDSLQAIGWMKEHGLDLADLSMGGNTDAMVDPHFFTEPAGFLSRADRVRREVGIPVATSWNLGVPATADAVIRQELIDVAMIGRPALSNPHRPVWAARELGHPAPFDLVPPDWRWWLSNFRGHAPSIGLPPTPDGVGAARGRRVGRGVRRAAALGPGRIAHGALGASSVRRLPTEDGDGRGPPSFRSYRARSGTSAGMARASRRKSKGFAPSQRTTRKRQPSNVLSPAEAIDAWTELAYGGRVGPLMNGG